MLSEVSAPYATSMPASTEDTDAVVLAVPAAREDLNGTASRHRERLARDTFRRRVGEYGGLLDARFTVPHGLLHLTPASFARCS